MIVKQRWDWRQRYSYQTSFWNAVDPRWWEFATEDSEVRIRVAGMA